MKNWQHFLVLLATFMFTQSMVFAQAQTIKGSIVDESGTPLPGVSIVIEGTNTGTVTDVDGLFSIEAEAGQNLVVRFVGMTSQIITVGSIDTFIEVILEQDVQSLEELVVVGYGTQKKESVVGAIGTAKGEELKSQGNVSTLREALTGTIPGLSVLAQSGLAGRNVDGGDSRNYRETELLIRGKTTWNNASPLILVDGIERDMNDINVNEVESVSVLKDASATAVFGVKGGNGVILITTKRGKTGKPKFNIEAEVSLETPSKIVRAAETADGIVALNHAIQRTRRIQGASSFANLTADQVVEYYREGTYPYAYPDNDWIDIMFKDFATSYKVNAYVDGGTEKVKYFASAGYNHFDDLFDAQDLGQGYVPNYEYDRMNIRTNFDFKITSSTPLSATFAGIHTNQKYPKGTSLNGIFNSLANLPGNSHVLQYEDGVFGRKNDLLSASNPYYTLNYAPVYRDLRTTINMDYTLRQDLKFITEGLSFSAKLAYDNLFANDGLREGNNGLRTKQIKPEFYLQGGYYDYDNQVYVLGGEPIPDMAAAGFATYEIGGSGNTGAGFGWVQEPTSYTSESLDLGGSSRNLYYEARMNYARNFGMHNVSGLAMFSRQQVERGSNWPSKREDWVGRVTYNYGERYLLEANGAYNGSEKFGPEYRFDFFPSVAVGWVISNEGFMEQTSEWLNNLKIRYSNGVVGNDRVNTGSTWPYLTIYEEAGGPTDIDGSLFGYPVSNYDQYKRYIEGVPGNPDLRWEKANKQNLGLEIGLFRNKIVFSADVFKEYRYDMLLAANQRGVPEISGKPPTAANVGEAKSQGMELQITYRNSLRDAKVNYWVTANWFYARSEVIYKESPDLVPPYQRPEGFPLDQTRTGISTGFINSWDDLYVNTGSVSITETRMLLPGDLVMLDYDSDGSYDSNWDNVPYGYPQYPQNNYSFSFGGDFKGIVVSAQFVGAYNVTRNIGVGMFSQGASYIPAYVLKDTWTKAYNNADPTYPALALNEKYMPEGQYERDDGSFLRLNSVQLGYNLPKKWTQKISIENLKVYVSGRNLLLWTRMPDDGVGGSYRGKNYPTKKQVNFGINIQF